MSDDRRSEPDARILRQMVRELSDDSLPELPWEKIEARLFSDLGAEGDVGAKRIAAPAPLDGAEPAEERASFLPEEGRPSAIPASIVAASPRESLLPREPAARSTARQPSRVGRWARAFTVAAAIAAGLGGIYLTSTGDHPGSVAVVAEPIDPALVPQAPGMPAGVLDAKSLGVGDVVEAALGPIAFGAFEAKGNGRPNVGPSHDSLAWTLAAGSRVVVREPASALVHVVELESGSVHVEASGPKRFVVRAGQTEVLSAATGASFTVTRSSRGLVVHVEAGSVFVGERGVAGERGKSGEGRLLDAPVRASVSLDGAREVELIPDEVATMMQPPAPAHAVPAHQPPEASSPSQAPVRAPYSGSAVGTEAPGEQPARNGSPDRALPEPAPQPAPTAPAAGPISESSIRAAVQRCFADVQSKKEPNAGVSVSVSSTLRVVVRADGSVQGVTFNPPLHGDLQSCAVFLFRENLGPGARTLAVPVAHK